jgi:hypothetical protein
LSKLGISGSDVNVRAEARIRLGWEPWSRPIFLYFPLIAIRFNFRRAVDNFGSVTVSTPFFTVERKKRIARFIAPNGHSLLLRRKRQPELFQMREFRFAAPARAKCRIVSRAPQA